MKTYEDISSLFIEIPIRHLLQCAQPWNGIPCLRLYFERIQLEYRLGAIKYTFSKRARFIVIFVQGWIIT